MFNMNSPIVQNMFQNGGMPNSMPPSYGSVQSIGGQDYNQQKPKIDLAELGRQRTQSQIDSWARYLGPNVNDKVFQVGSPNVPEPIVNQPIQPAFQNTGYNPYAYSASPFTYNNGYYGNTYSYGYNPYSLSYNEQLKRQQEAMQAEIDMWATLSVGVHKFMGQEITMEQAREFYTPKPDGGIEDYYKNKTEEVEYPSIILTRGDEVILKTERKKVTLSGEELKQQDFKQFNIARISTTAYKGNMLMDYANYKAATLQEAYRKRYPLDMSLSDFFGPLGNQMYREYLEDEIEKQQRQVNLLYDKSAYAKLIRDHAKATNPYAYNSFAMAIANNGRIDQPRFNLGDMEIDLPNRLQGEAARRRHEFLEKIFAKESESKALYGKS